MTHRLLLWAELPQLLPAIQWMKSNITTSEIPTCDRSCSKFPFYCYYWHNQKIFQYWSFCQRLLYCQVKVPILLPLTLNWINLTQLAGFYLGSLMDNTTNSQFISCLFFWLINESVQNIINNDKCVSQAMRAKSNVKIWLVLCEMVYLSSFWTAYSHQQLKSLSIQFVII